MAERLGFWRRLLFAGILVGVAALSIEIPLQLFYRVTAGEWLFRRVLPRIYEADATRCYRVKPNLDYVHRTNEFTIRIFTNAQSFRTDARREPVAIEKPSDVYRVMFLGPSFTFGWGSDHEDTYAARIAAGLRVPGKRVELINVGTPAQPYDQQLCWLEREGHRYRPDLIVQTSYGDHVSPMPTSCPPTLDCPYIEDSLVYSTRPTARQHAVAVAKSFASVFYGFYLFHALAAPEAAPRVGTGRDLYGAGVASDGGVPALVESYRRYFELTRGLTGQATRFAVIHLPFSFLVHRDDRSRWNHIVDVEPEQALELTRSELQALRAAGIVVVDPVDLLIERGASERQYFWLDIHLTPAGNRAVTEAALPVLQPLVLGP
jgi:hypothetical protein